MKKGLVMEGGAMRGLFTAGVLDVFMENGIEFDGAVGVSAGAAFGCNIKSRQIGRVIGYVKRFCNDDRFCSWKSFFTTGDLYGAKFGYEDLPNIYAPFDREAFNNNPLDFYVVATDVNTGRAVYHLMKDASDNEIKWILASASMPLVSRVVKLDGYELLDGGMADSIPVRFFEEKGYEKKVVILTQPVGFVKKKNPLLWLMKLVLRKYPALISVMAKRHDNYNETTAYIEEQERQGKLFVIRPPEALKIGGVEHDPNEIERVYRIGRKVGEAQVEAVKAYLSEA